MSVEEDAKALVRQYVAAFNRGDLEALRGALAIKVPLPIRD